MLRRSTINKSIEVAKEVFSRSVLRLPGFAFWTSDDWLKVGEEADEIRDCMLGWDVTDFGSGDFTNIGRTLFTLRNGRHNNPKYPKSYAEKFILDPEGQRAPAHFHRSKREDIINRGTGFIVLELTKSGKDGQPALGSMTVAIDGISKIISSGDRVVYGVSGEVSSVCDDRNDNVFIAGQSCRFPEIDEDEKRIHYLCNEYLTA